MYTSIIVCIVFHYKLLLLQNRMPPKGSSIEMNTSSYTQDLVSPGGKSPKRRAERYLVRIANFFFSLEKKRFIYIIYKKRREKKKRGWGDKEAGK